MAEELFARGLADADAGRLEAAAESLRASLAARPSERTAFNLARVLSDLGELVEAASLLRSITLDPGSDLLIRDAARALLAEVSPRVATIEVELAGATDGRILLLDDRPIDPRVASSGMPIDPGRHVLSLSEPSGRLVLRKTLAIEPGDDARARLVAVPSPDGVSGPAGGAAPGSAEDDAPITSRWWFWGGAGAAAVAVAVIVGALLASDGESPAAGDVDPIFVGGG